MLKATRARIRARTRRKTCREEEMQRLRKQLISREGPNGQAALVVAQLGTEFMAVDNMPFIEKIYGQVQKTREQIHRKALEASQDANVPQKEKERAELQLEVTGSAPIGFRHAQLDEGEHREHGLRRSCWWSSFC